MIEATLGIVFKDKDDVEFVKQSLPGFMDRVGIQMKELLCKADSANAA